MSALPEEIKVTYLLMIGIFMLFVFFVILFVLVYKNKQTILFNENAFKETLLQKQKLEAELEKLNALQSERDRISIDMHDDLGSGLSSIKLISEMLKKKHKDEDTRNDLNQIVENATELTSTMREMVWSLNPRNDKLETFILHLNDYAQHFFEPSEIKLEVNIPESIPDLIMSGFTRRNLFLCFKESLNNIIKHARAQKVIITVAIHTNMLRISIQDDGIGLSENHKPNNGFYNMQKRIKDCNGIIQWHPAQPGLITEIEMSLS